jgi:hypothetical protein
MKNIYLYIIYPLFTYWFASQANLFSENLSIAGSKENMHFIFILWAISLSIAFSIGFSKCIYKSMHSKYLVPLLGLSLGIFLFAVFLPYQPESFPILSELHITLSFLGLFLLLIVIALLIISLRFTYFIYPFDLYLVFIYISALGIFGSNYMSVNSLVEIFLAILLPIYLFHLGKRLNKNSD